MKMISRKTSSIRRIALILAVSVLLVAILSFASIRSFVSFGSAVLPLYSGKHYASDVIQSIQNYGAGLSTVTSERDNLLRERAEHVAEIESLKALFAEKDAIESLLLKQREGRISAGVLNSPNSTPYDTILLDRGENAGITQHAIVYSVGNRPIGSVVRVEKHTAVVALFTSPGITSRVFVLGPNISARAEGEGAGILKIFIPQGVSFHVGDTVLYPTLSSSIIGIIQRIDADPAQPDQYGYISTSDAIASLRYVSVAPVGFALPSNEDIYTAIRNASSTVEGFFTLPPVLHAEQAATSTDAE